MWATRFTTMFGLEHPIMSAPMAAHSGGTLAAAVTSAGGLGAFGGLNPGRPPTWIDEQMRYVRSVTDGPVAVGFITDFLPFTGELFDVAIATRPDAMALSFGDPGPWAPRVKDADITLICQVQTLESAEAAMAAGADVLVAQGTEAGGHTGTVGLLPLLTAVVERWPDVPVLAAGGIGDGRALAAAIAAGADGAWLGTALLATPEAVEVDPGYKQMIIESDGGDTVLTKVYDIASGLPWPVAIQDRVRRNRFVDRWTGHEDELAGRRDDPEVAAALIPAEFDASIHAVRYGQAAAAVDRIRPAGEVVRSISDEAARQLRARVELAPDEHGAAGRVAGEPAVSPSG
jgi:nitronate monooxygenase